MHTLIFDGSPHKNGDTAALVRALKSNLQGECTVIRAYGANVSPCIDCRACWKKPGCAIQDGMQEIYRLIEACDAIVIACPIYYSELTGPLSEAASQSEAQAGRNTALRRGKRRPGTSDGNCKNFASLHECQRNCRACHEPAYG